MFDLTDLNTDLNEFNDFYNNNESHYNQIERPKNPFEKNFQSYKSNDKKMNLRNSFSDLHRDNLLAGPTSESQLKKNTSLSDREFAELISAAQNPVSQRNEDKQVAMRHFDTTGVER